MARMDACSVILSLPFDTELGGFIMFHPFHRPPGVSKECAFLGQEACARPWHCRGLCDTRVERVSVVFDISHVNVQRKGKGTDN